MIGHKAQDAMLASWINEAMQDKVHVCAVDGCRDETTKKVGGYEMCEGHTIRYILTEMGEADEYWLGVYMADLMKLDWIGEVTL